MGLVSITLWGVSELPQIIANFIDGRSEGVSDLFLITWTFGDILNVAGCLVSDTLPTQLYTAILYTVITLALDVQHVWFEYLRPKFARSSEVKAVNATAAPDAETPTGLGQPPAGATTSPAATTAAHLVPSPSISSHHIHIPHQNHVPGAHPDATSHYGSLRSMSSFHSHRPPLLSSSLTRTLSIPQPQPSSPPTCAILPTIPSAINTRPGSPSLHPASLAPATSGSPFYSTASFEDPIEGIIGHMDMEEHGSDVADQPNQPRPGNSTRLRAAAPATFLALYLLYSAASSTQVASNTTRHLLQASSTTPQEATLQAWKNSSFLGISSEVWGQALGWAMTVVYISGRLPQIVKNFRRKSTAGLSAEMFVLVIAANLTYTLSILIRSLKWEDIKPKLPWLVDAVLCLVADFVIMAQVVLYRHFREEDEKERVLVGGVGGSFVGDAAAVDVGQRDVDELSRPLLSESGRKW